MRFKSLFLVLIMTIFFTIQVSATGLVDQSYRKTISQGYAIKDYLFSFSAYWQMQVIGDGESFLNSPFLRIYRETEDGLEPVLIRIKKDSETPITGDLLDWFTYGTNITTFTIQPVDPESLPDGNYYYVFEHPVTLISFAYNCLGDAMPVYNENSTIVDFDNVLRDIEVMLKNRLQDIHNELVYMSNTVENNIDNSLNDIKTKLDKLDIINSNLLINTSAINNLRTDVQGLNTAISDTNDKIDTILYRLGFLVYIIVVCGSAYLSWRIFKFYILNGFRYILKRIL